MKTSRSMQERRAPINDFWISVEANSSQKETEESLRQNPSAKKTEARSCSNDVALDYYELYNALDRKTGPLTDENNICSVHRGDAFWKTDSLLSRHTQERFTSPDKKANPQTFLLGGG